MAKVVKKTKITIHFSKLLHRSQFFVIFVAKNFVTMKPPSPPRGSKGNKDDDLNL